MRNRRERHHHYPRKHWFLIHGLNIVMLVLAAIFTPPFRWRKRK